MKYNISWSSTAHDTYIFILEHLIETWGTEKAFDFDVKTMPLLDTLILKTFVRLQKQILK